MFESTKIYGYYLKIKTFYRRVSRCFIIVLFCIVYMKIDFMWLFFGNKNSLLDNSENEKLQEKTAKSNAKCQCQWYWQSLKMAEYLYVFV